MIANKCWAISPLLLLPSLVLAGEGSKPNTQSNIQLVFGKTIILEAHQAPLARVLDEIAAKSGMDIHHSVPAETLVTTRCQGADAKQIVQCVLGAEANLVFRHQGKASQPGRNVNIPVELWVLGEGAKSTQAVPRHGAIVRSKESVSKPGEIGKLLKMAASADAVGRAQAISLLAADRHADEAAILEALETALTDPDASVREQAVYGLSRRDAPGAASRLLDALHDSDASVRLMAVDSARTDAQGIALLKQALADSDETVSTLAATKLESLSNPTIPK